MKEQKSSDKVTLTCSVVTFDPWSFTVNWLRNEKILEGSRRQQISDRNLCAVALELSPSDQIYESGLNSLKCEVRDNLDRSVHQFAFSPSSAEKPGESPFICCISGQLYEPFSRLRSSVLL